MADVATQFGALGPGIETQPHGGSISHTAHTWVYLGVSFRMLLQHILWALLNKPVPYNLVRKQAVDCRGFSYAAW
jgi:hypothetical protein